MELSELSEALQKKLASFKGLIVDGDGVLFSGEEYRASLSSGEVIVMKSRHHHDGQGISFLRAIGIKILVATGEGQPAGSIVEKWNELRSARNGTFTRVSVLMDLNREESKVAAIEKWLTAENLTWEECAYLGDDRTDWEAMQHAGLSATPSNGQRLIRKIAHFGLTKEGGKGAIREFAELVLDARGIDETTLPAA